MSHQPYEDWILDPVTLTADERRVLQAHLMVCEQCQQLDRRWQTVHQQLRSQGTVPPVPGFAQRWQTSLAERKTRQQRQQAWKIFGFLIGGALFILLLLATYTAATTSPAEWLGAFVRTYTSSQSIIDLVGYAIMSWFSKAPLAVNVALWVYLIIILAGLMMAWSLIIWRTNAVGATQS